MTDFVLTNVLTLIGIGALVVIAEGVAFLQHFFG